MKGSYIGFVTMVGLAALVAWWCDGGRGEALRDSSIAGRSLERELGDFEQRRLFADSGAGEARTPAVPHAHSTVDSPPSESARPLVRRIVGTIQGSAGEPIPGAVVAVVTVQPGRFGHVDELIRCRHAISPRAEAKTDVDGRFEIVDPMAGPVALEAISPGSLPLLHSTYVPTLGPAVDVGILRMQPGLRLVGEVRDESGRGIEGAQLALVNEAELGPIYAGSFGKRVLARTATSGAFTTDVIAPGAWVVAVSAAGHVAQTFRGEEARDGLIFVLQSGTAIRGRVLGTEGLDPEGLAVHLVTTSAQRKSHEVLRRPWNEVEFAKAPCDEGGAFALTPIPRTLDYEMFALEVRHHGALLPLTAEGRARPGTDDVVLQVEAPFIVKFTAIDLATGGPISDVSVKIGVALADTGQLLGWQSAPSIALDGGRHRVRLQENPGRTQTLRVLPTGFESFRSAPLVPHSGGEVDFGRLEFTPQAVDVVHVVDDLTGAPVAGAEVSVQPRHDAAEARPAERTHAGGGCFVPVRSDTARTDESGLARLNRFPGGEAEIVVEHSAYAPRRPWPIDMGAPSTEHRLEVGQGAALRLDIEKNGQPVLGALVELADDQPQNSGGETDDAAYVPRGLSGFTKDDGTLVFDALPVGTYRFLVVEPAAAVIDVHVEGPGLIERKVSL